MPSLSRSDLIAEARAYIAAGVAKTPRHGFAIIADLADALEAAESRATEAEAERDRLVSLRDRWQETVSAPSFVSAVEAEARAYHESACAYQQQRDAALAVIENVRGLVEMWEWITERGDVLEALSSVPADVLRERDRRVRAEARAEGHREGYQTGLHEALTVLPRPDEDARSGMIHARGLIAARLIEQNSEGNET